VDNEYDLQINSIEELVPYVAKHLVPLIEDAVNSCERCYQIDPYNDRWTFGTQLWRVIWNRFQSLSNAETSPIECLPGNIYAFRIGQATLRHHRVRNFNAIPKSAKAAKEEADGVFKQLTLFDDREYFNKDIQNVILAIAAEPEVGLSAIFLGKLIKDNESKGYQWAITVPVVSYQEGAFEADSFLLDEPLTAEYSPEEKEPVPSVKLNIKESKKTKPASIKK
jgi:hypothetical protein